MRKFITAIIGLAVVLCHVPLRAETVKLSEIQQLTFREAITRTLADAPELALSKQEVRVAHAKQHQAELGENPTFSAVVEDVLGSGNASGIDAAQSTLSLNFVLDNQLVNKRAASASALTMLATTEVEITMVDAAADTARRYIEVLGAEADLGLHESALEFARQTVRIVSDRVEAGRSPGVELLRAEAEVARAELALEDGKHELKVARHLLAARWGVSQPDFKNLENTLDSLPAPIGWQALMTRFESRGPIQKRFLSMARLAEANLSLERARQRRPIEYQVGIRHRNAVNDVALVAGISIPLGIKHKNEGNIRAAEKQLDVVAAEAELTRIEIKARLYELYEGMTHSLHQAHVLNDTVLPLLEQARQQTQAAYERGRYSYQEVQSVQQELLQTKRSLIAASINAHLQLIEIERLTGISLPGNPPHE